MPEFHSLKVKEIVRETNDTVSVSFQVPEDLKSICFYTRTIPYFKANHQ